MKKKMILLRNDAELILVNTQHICMYIHKELRDIPYSQDTDRKGREEREVKNPWRQLRATAVIQTIT